MKSKDRSDRVWLVWSAGANSESKKQISLIQAKSYHATVQIEAIKKLDIGMGSFLLCWRL